MAMEKAIELMLDNIQEGIVVETLADAVGMSRSTFMREFKRRFNITPAKYLTLQRVDMAASLLGASDESIEEVAALTGFYDRYHLTKAFKRLRGCTPVAHRKQVQSREPTSTHQG